VRARYLVVWECPVGFECMRWSLGSEDGWSLWTGWRRFSSRGMSGELGVAVSALGNLGGSIAGLSASLAEQQQQEEP
jgi:hypothetical protein